MKPYLKKYCTTFLLLHLLFATIFVLCCKLFADLTIELFAYLFGFILIFGLCATLLQTIIFSIISSRKRINKTVFFIIAIVVELSVANLLVVYAAGSESFTGDLINDIKLHNDWHNLAGSLLLHISLVAATLIISFARKIN